MLENKCRIKREHIDKALEIIDRNPRHYVDGDSVLVKNGRLYSPRHVYAVARQLTGNTKSISRKGIAEDDAKAFLTRHRFGFHDQTPEQVLVNIMYSGDYVNEKRSSDENIGHEWINLHADDKGKHYIFVTKSGTIDSRRRINTILLVRALSKTMTPLKYGNGKPCKTENGKRLVVPVDNSVEVVAKAVGCSPVNDGNLMWAKKAKITYGQIDLEEIFGRNMFDGRRESLETICATYEADKVVKVKPGIKIILRRSSDAYTDGEEEGKEEAIVMWCDTRNQDGETIVELFLSKCPNNQSLRLFVVPDEKLRKVIEDKKWWESNPVGKFTVRRKDNDGSVSSCFLTTIGKLKDELSYSNLIAHYLRANDVVCASFVNWLLGKDSERALKDPNGKVVEVSEKNVSFSVEREEDHIDLLIRDKDGEGKGKYLIVIENKVLSGINGKVENGGQLTDYAQKAYAKCYSDLIPPPQNPPKSKKPKEPETVSENNKNKQPNKQINPDKGRTPLFFILAPNYSRISNEERKTKKGATYKVRNNNLSVKNKKLKSFEYVPITYGDILKFFAQFSADKNQKHLCNEIFDDDKIQRSHFKEFLTALKVHARRTDNINELIMEDRAVRAIKRAKAKRNAQKQRKAPMG